MRCRDRGREESQALSRNSGQPSVSTVLGRLADRYGVQGSPEARRELAEYIAEVLPDHPRQIDFERAVRQFQARGALLSGAAGRGGTA